MGPVVRALCSCEKTIPIPSVCHVCFHNCVVVPMSPKGRKVNKLTMCSDEVRGLLAASSHGAV